MLSFLILLFIFTKIATHLTAHLPLQGSCYNFVSNRLFQKFVILQDENKTKLKIKYIHISILPRCYT